MNTKMQDIVTHYIESVGSCAEAARTIGVQRQLVHLWRTGQQRPSISTLIRVLVDFPNDSLLRRFALDALWERLPALADILERQSHEESPQNPDQKSYPR